MPNKALLTIVNYMSLKKSYLLALTQVYCRSRDSRKKPTISNQVERVFFAWNFEFFLFFTWNKKKRLFENVYLLKYPKHFQAYVKFAVFLQLKKLKFYILHFLEEKKSSFTYNSATKTLCNVLRGCFFSNILSYMWLDYEPI